MGQSAPLHFRNMDERSQPFARVKMDGERFAGGRLPVHTLTELLRYQNVIRAAAEQQWREDHPGQELPHDFEASFQLTLADVEDGSAISVLERPSQSLYDDYYEDARDELERELEAALSPNPNVRDIPLLAFPDFVELGSSLGRNESLYVFYGDTANEPSHKITREISTEILQPLRTAYVGIPALPVGQPERTTVTGWLVGRLVAINADRENYSINSLRHGVVNGKYKKSEVLEDLKAVLGSSEKAPLVRLYADLRFLGDKLDRILDVRKVQLLEIDGEPWSRRFIELASLEPGWNDEAPDSEPIAFSAIDGARAILNFVKKTDLPLPGLFPLEDGGVNIEWASPEHVVSIEVDPDAHFAFFSTNRGGSEVVDGETRDLDEVKKFILGAKL